VKRFVVVLLVVGALAMPAAAIAAVRHFKGPVNPSGNVAFPARVHSGKVVRVKPGFAFNHIPMTCNEGARTISGSFNFAMAVHRRHFSGTGTFTSSAGQGTVAVTGAFKHHGRRAVGTINAHGNFSPGGVTVTGCHSGSLTWHAHVS
jgi:hypothetical protein